MGGKVRGSKGGHDRDNIMASQVTWSSQGMNNTPYIVRAEEEPLSIYNKTGRTKTNFGNIYPEYRRTDICPTVYTS